VHQINGAFFLSHEFFMANATSTKPSAEQQTIPGTETPATPPAFPGIAGTFFLPRSMDEMVKRKDGTTYAAVRVHRDGADKHYCGFTVQFTYREDEESKRVYSDVRLNLIAHGKLADQVIELIQSGEMLADITAFYGGKNKDNYDQFVIKSICNHPRA
tara:strand:- start:1643 stop:2116 length:474 start_codon:yes stop_codon:yes gene_type:complete